jgi:tetratricopeptide (TPR) repeat protein
MKKILLVLLLISFVFGDTQKKAKDDIDHLALAALLIKDGYVQKAHEELLQVDLQDEKLDFVRYYTLSALVASKQEQYAESNNFFQLAIDAGEENKALYLYMAQNSFKLSAYKETLLYIEKAGALADEKASVYALKAESHYKLGESDKALQTLQHAMNLFPTEYNFYKQRFNYLVSLALYQSALEDANYFIKHANPDEKTSIAFVSAFSKAKETKKAIELAEELSLKYPESATVTVLLAHLYIDNEMISSAANLFDEASYKDEKYTAEAAEMLRRAKKFVLALYKNAQMLDTKEKLKQRVAIYLEYGAYERIVVSHNALKRSGLIEDENIRYALAYAYYMVGDFIACEQELKAITRNDLFQKATELRKNIQKCKNDGWECEL